MLPPDFRLRLEGPIVLGGEPFAVTRYGQAAERRIQGWRDGAPVGDGGALARALVMCNLAQPVPPAGELPPVSAVIPVRDRSIARLLAALDFDRPGERPRGRRARDPGRAGAPVIREVIVVDDASADGEALRAEAEAAGARYLRRERRGGAGAARNDGLAAARHALVACIDSDCVPLPGWLEALLPHLADPELCAVAPRIVAFDEGEARDGSRRRFAERRLARYEAARSPLDRGPAGARVLPYGRVPFVPGAALLVRNHLRFDETLHGGEDVEFVWRVPYVRYEPAGAVAHDHRTHPRAWLERRAYYGRTAAGIARRHPGRARPLNVSPWTTVAWLALAARRPAAAAAITTTATALLARELDDEVPDPIRTAARLAGLGTLRSGRVVAAALTRHWWPLSLLAALVAPRTRLALAAAILSDPERLPDDLAYGYGLWRGCVAERTLDPLLPARPWRLARRDLP